MMSFWRRALVQMMFIQLLVGFLVIWYLVMRWRRRRFEELYKQLRISTLRLPFIGHLHSLLCSGEGIMKKLQQLGREAIEAGGISGFWMAHKLYIVVADPEVAEVILKTCLEKDDLMKCFHMAIGDGSIFASVKKWRPRRKHLMAPTFSQANLGRFAVNFSEQSWFLAEKLRPAAGAGAGPVALWRMFSLYSFDSILASLGLQVNAQKNAEHPFLVAVEDVLTQISDRVFKPWLHSDFIYKLLPRYYALMKHKPIVYNFIDKIISETVQKREQNESYNTDLKNGATPGRVKTIIELMVESGRQDSVAVREECMVIMGAASDTSAVGLGFASLMLARHPEIQDKIYVELKEVIGDVRPITPEDLPRLKYLDAFIRETLRMYPSVPTIVRKIDKDIQLPSGVTLLAGCGAFINIWAVNRNPKYWGEDAEEFRPERFLDAAPRHPAAFMTFSYGPRNCLGYQYAIMSLKTVMATLVQQYRILPASEELKNEPLRVSFDIMMRHVDKYCVRIEPRK